jgi:periplasmic protein TonB
VAPPFAGDYRLRFGALAFIAAAHAAVALWLLASHMVISRLAATPAMVAILHPAPARQLPEVVPIPAPRIREQLPSPPFPAVEIRISAAPLPATISRPPAAPPAAATPQVAAEPAPVEPPRADLAYLDNPAPRYPALSRRQGEQGRVLLRVRVNAAGGVEAVEVRASSGFERLDAAALEAVRHWRFVPARRGREALEGWALVPIDFHLDGGTRRAS